MSYICPDCENEYQRIGQHWSLGSCQYPELSGEQEEILVGLMMGDGTLARSQKGTPRIQANMTNVDYLNHIDSKFPNLSAGVTQVYTAEENALRDRESGFNPDASADDYSDTYRWSTVTADTFDMFTDWYQNGDKLWPERPFTETSLKHLYCCDGYRHDSGSHNNITIAMNNESDNTDKIDRMFEDAGLPTPSWQVYEKNGRTDVTARFTKADSRLLWDYMGEPLPGFDYKWPTSARS